MKIPGLTQARALQAIFGLGATMLLVGGWFDRPLLAACGVGGCAFAIGRWIARSRRLARRDAELALAPEVQALANAAHEPSVTPKRTRSGGTDANELIEEMLGHGRYALLLRPQLVTNLNAEQRSRTLVEISKGMSLTPPGAVALLSPSAALEAGGRFERDNPRYRPLLSRVEGYCLDRYPVTNAEFQQFIEAGGYEQPSLWEAEIQAMIVEFVDQTGCLGPRFWKNGHHDRELAQHPVVGVSWYEAAAYARWVGKRLPSDAEWVKAACWPVAMGGASAAQRKYPWGENMDHERANLWSSGFGMTVSVDAMPLGASLGGVHQLVGNVWEWNAGDYGLGEDDLSRGGDAGQTLKSIRGGAFDTYFDSQASCQFQSGEKPLERKHNIGFRCALSLCDLAGQAELSDTPAENQKIESELVEVV